MRHLLLAALVAVPLGRIQAQRQAFASQGTIIGVPLEGQLFIQPLKFLGVGLYGYGDLNKERSFWGWSIGAAVGRLR